MRYAAVLLPEYFQKTYDSFGFFEVYLYVSLEDYRSLAAGFLKDFLTVLSSFFQGSFQVTPRTFHTSSILNWSLLWLSSLKRFLWTDWNFTLAITFGFSSEIRKEMGKFPNRGCSLATILYIFPFKVHRLLPAEILFKGGERVLKFNLRLIDQWPVSWGVCVNFLLLASFHVGALLLFHFVDCFLFDSLVLPFLLFLSFEPPLGRGITAQSKAIIKHAPQIGFATFICLCVCRRRRRRLPLLSLCFWGGIDHIKPFNFGCDTP